MVTIKDIAEDTGLSPATVARALSESGPARPETRAKVRESADRLGYVASTAAKSMRRQSSDMVGLIIPDIVNRFYSEMARAMAAACDAKGLHFLLALTGDDPARELKQMRAMVSARAAAVALVPGPNTDPGMVPMIGRQPFAQLVRKSADLATDWFGFDEAAGMKDATAHLLDLGHRDILLICGSNQYSTGRAREKGYRDAFEERGLQVDETFVRAGRPTMAFGRDAMIDVPSRVTAVMTAATMLTEGVADVLAQRAVAVPGELSFVGFGVENWHRWWNGGMTRLVPPVDAMAMSSIEHLLEMVRQFDRNLQPPLTQHQLKSQLVVGRTTAKR